MMKQKTFKPKSKANKQQFPLIICPLSLDELNKITGGGGCGSGGTGPSGKAIASIF